MIQIEWIGVPKEVDLKTVERVVRRTFLVGKHVTSGSVSVRFVSPAEIQRLNRVWRKKNKPTDVLSFPQVSVPGEKVRMWGDIVIAYAMVRAEAKRRHIDVAEEIGRMISHGVLHLCGFDHATDEQELQMFTIQEQIVAECYE